MDFPEVPFFWLLSLLTLLPPSTPEAAARLCRMPALARMDGRTLTLGTLVPCSEQPPVLLPPSAPWEFAQICGYYKPIIIIYHYIAQGANASTCHYRGAAQKKKKSLRNNKVAAASGRRYRQEIGEKFGAGLAPRESISIGAAPLLSPRANPTAEIIHFPLFSAATH